MVVWKANCTSSWWQCLDWSHDARRIIEDWLEERDTLRDAIPALTLMPVRQSLEVAFTNYTAKAQNKTVSSCFYAIKLPTVTKVPCPAKRSSPASFPIPHFISCFCFFVLPSYFKMVAKEEVFFSFFVSKWHPLFVRQTHACGKGVMFVLGAHMNTRQCTDFLWLTNSECLCMVNMWLQAGTQGALAPSTLINNRRPRLLPWAENQLKPAAAKLNAVSRQCCTER